MTLQRHSGKEKLKKCVKCGLHDYTDDIKCFKCKGEMIEIEQKEGKISKRQKRSKKKPKKQPKIKCFSPQLFHR